MPNILREMMCDDLVALYEDICSQSNEHYTAGDMAAVKRCDDLIDRLMDEMHERGLL